VPAAPVFFPVFSAFGFQLDLLRPLFLLTLDFQPGLPRLFFLLTLDFQPGLPRSFFLLTLDFQPGLPRSFFLLTLDFQPGLPRSLFLLPALTLLLLSSLGGYGCLSRLLLDHAPLVSLSFYSLRSRLQFFCPLKFGPGRSTILPTSVQIAALGSLAAPLHRCGHWPKVTCRLPVNPLCF
jgi:hypothetical protein